MDTDISYQMESDCSNPGPDHMNIEIPEVCAAATSEYTEKGAATSDEAAKNALEMLQQVRTASYGNRKAYVEDFDEDSANEDEDVIQ